MDLNAFRLSSRHWRRGSLIGSGSFGNVNIAMDTETCELFAVKSIKCCESAMSELLAMENELQILQSLDSPWIVRCFGSDYTVEDGVRIRNLFLEYMPGGSLADFMKKFGGQLQESVIRVYTRCILQALQYIHEQGVVHCDIKGKNILIGSMGAKLADFGSAKRIGSAFPALGSMKGTPLWMAPEVLQQIEQGPASDIWSLGCTVVEMATGKSPWNNSTNPFSALYKIACTDELPAFPDFLSEEGKDFLRRCFVRDVSARWSSAQLLEHPFVKKQNYSPRFVTPSSPTSILDFPAAMPDWDTHSTDLNSVPLLSLHKRIHRRDKLSNAEEGKSFDQPNSSTFPAEDQWITVRSPKGCTETRLRPLSDFMLQSSSHVSGADDRPLSVKKACDVNLDSIAFLRSRRRTNCHQQQHQEQE